MFRSKEAAPAWRRSILWLALLSLLAQPSSLYADDDCERLTETGATRDCTYTEELRECFDEANQAFDDCIHDAKKIDSLVERAINYAGCEASALVNIWACVISVSSDWAL